MTVTSQVVVEVRIMAVIAVLTENSFLQCCQQLNNTAKTRCQVRLHILDSIEDRNIYNRLPPQWSPHRCPQQVAGQHQAWSAT